MVTSKAHKWQVYNLSPTIALSKGSQSNTLKNGKILFKVTGLKGNLTTMSTMRFNASVDVISNGSWVSCTTDDGVTLNETIVTFGE